MQTETEPADPATLDFFKALSEGGNVEVMEARMIAAHASTDALSVLRQIRNDHFPDYVQAHRLRMMTALAGQAAGMEWTAEGVRITVPPILRDALAFA